MCRLLGFVSTKSASIVDVMGQTDFDRFTALSAQHSDGWGMAWWPASGAELMRPRTIHSISRAADDPHFAEVTSAERTDAGLIHLRWATAGLPVEVANTHPFVHGDRAFAHNGAVHPLARINDIAPPTWSRRADGTTDSEQYFLAILGALERSGRMDEAAGAVVTRLFADFAPTSLNAMLLTPRELYVICAHDPSRGPVIAPQGGSDLHEPDPEFYELRYRRYTGSIVVASSGLYSGTKEAWVHIENMTLTRIERRSLAISTWSIGNGDATSRLSFLRDTE